MTYETSVLFGTHAVSPSIQYKVENNLALESTSSLQCASDILHMSYQMEHTFLGLSGPSRNAGIYFRVLANMLWFFGIMKQIST